MQHAGLADLRGWGAQPQRRSGRKTAATARLHVLALLATRHTVSRSAALAATDRTHLMAPQLPVPLAV